MHTDSTRKIENGHTHNHEHHHEHVREDATLRQLPAGALVLTLRASSGVSGDMMLSGLAALARLDGKTLDDITEELALPALGRSVTLEERSVNSVSGVGCKVTLPHEHTHRTLTDIERIIASSHMPDTSRELSIKTFRLLAEAEGSVHGRRPEEVSFHEVGALDSILDICLVCRIFGLLRPDHFICSPLPMADGIISCAHGLIHSPAPAVLRLLDGVPVCEFYGRGETVTPTAIALLKALGADFGPWPRMTVQQSVISYGNKVFENAPNGALWILGKA